jgi:hypothetical protein
VETQLSYDTLRTIESELLQGDAVPLFGQSPDFPLEKIQQALAKLFERADLQMSSGIPEWKKGAQISAELGAQPFIIRLKVVNFPSAFYWATTEQDIVQLTTALIDPPAPAENMIDKEFQLAFYHFCLLETLSVLHKENYAQDLTFQLVDTPSSLPDISFLKISLSLVTSGKKLTGHLLLPQDFLNDWRQHFVPRKPSFLSKELRQRLEVTVSAEGGQVTLSSQEWAQLNEGDLVLLDNCSIDPATHKGSVLLTAYGKPIFHAELSPEGIQLQEPVTHHEAS